MSGTVDQESTWIRFLTWFGSSRVGAWTIITLGTRVDRWLIRATNGRFNFTFAWPCLLLTTKGVKTGMARTVSLVYFHDGEEIVLIASKGGNLRHPAWYLNLKANPGVDVFLDGGRAAYTARDATGDERGRLWAKAVGHYKEYELIRTGQGGYTGSSAQTLLVSF